jgi:hypothetical protein
MRPPWFERIPPALSSRWNVVECANAATTQILPADRTRWGILLLPSTVYNTLVIPGMDNASTNICWYMAAAIQNAYHLTFCEYGELVWHPFFVYHANGTAINHECIVQYLPADAWAKIYSEAITDLRPPARYPG